MVTDGDADSPAMDEPVSPSRRTAALAIAAVLVAPVLDFLPAILGLVHYAPQALQSGIATIRRPGFLPGKPYIDPNVGFNSQALGHAAAIQWLHGQVPWWNPLAGVGMPLAASSQTASFLPFTLLQALSSGTMWFHLALSCVAGLSMFALLRAMRCSPLAAACGAIAFEVGGSFAWVTNAAMNPVAFMPLCLLGIELLARRDSPRERAGVAALGAGTWLTLVAGFPEVTMFTVGLCTAWLVVRLFEQPGRALRTAVLSAAGAALGVAVAAPMLNASVRLLRAANIGGHVAHLSQVVIPKTGLAQFVTPYVFGGIFESADRTVVGAWQKTGGYAGVALLVLAVGALLGGHDRWLRWVLGAWALLFIGSAFNAPVLHTMVARLPGLTHVAVYRYATASALLCMCVLAARCIDDLRADRPLRRALRVAAGLAAAVGLLAVALRASAASRTWTQLHLPTWYRGSLLVFLGVAIVLSGSLLLWRWRDLTAVVVGAVLVAEALGAFVVPILAFPREVAYDTGPVKFLSASLGPQRYYTMKPVSPNWGSFYDVASLNAADLPIPTVWSNFVHDSLNDNENPWQFGIGRAISPTGLTTLTAFVANMPAFELAGTKFLVVPPWVHLDSYLQPRALAGAPVAVGGSTVTLTWRPPDYLAGAVVADVVVALPLGLPPGLAASACSGRTCVTATPITAVPGGTLFQLRSPLHLADTLAVTLHAPASATVTVLTVPVAPTSTAEVVADGAKVARRGGVVRLTYVPSSLPREVAATRLSRIYQLPNPVPLASAPGCRVATHSFTSFTATCSRATTMTYHQLAYAGWQASVRGATVPTTTVNGTFLRVDLPKGTSSVSFDYRPPDSQLAWAAMALGLLGLLAVLTWGRRTPRRRTVTPASKQAPPAPTTGSWDPGGAHARRPDPAASVEDAKGLADQ